ncbi:sel1 repeat family protein [Sulfurospirillum arcachonense]|uniref:sel1 repeat family protein n=1 Tax=Sulfurospirillum arcachonense TaxID=57666 RepID=UPI0004699CF6|nr:sel1 repeat family protein [Sulfurospirillum arcachonense]
MKYKLGFILLTIFIIISILVITNIKTYTEEDFIILPKYSKKNNSEKEFFKKLHIEALDITNKKNEPNIKKIYESECANGNYGICFVLGNIYSNDNIEKAKKYYSKACNGGLNMACIALDSLKN